MASSTWKANAALALGTLLIAASAAGLLGEWAVRYRERHRDTVPGSMPTLFYRHQTLGYALERGSSYFDWVHIDAQGFRGPDVSLAKVPGTTRIMVVGASTTFDIGVTRDDRAWPARLAVHLQELDPARRVEVINAGVGGYVVLHDIIRLVTEYPAYAPDLIIFYQGHNDLFGSLNPARGAGGAGTTTPGEVATMMPWTYWLSRHSLFYAKVLTKVGLIRFRQSGERLSAPPDLLDRGAVTFARSVNAFLAMARSMDIPVIVPEIVQVSGVGATHEDDPAVRASWAGAVPFANPDLVLQGYGRFNAALRAAAEKQGARFVPTGDFGLRGPAWYVTGDPIHFNDAGADRMAQGMAKAIVSLGVLEPGANASRPPAARAR